MAKKTRLGQNNQSSSTNSTSTILPPESAEVVDIILTDKHPRYRTVSDIGAIVFRRMISDYRKPESQLSIAHQLDSNFKKYPIKHEIVFIYQAPIPQSSIVDKTVGFYYNTIVNVWGYQNNNALPYSTINVDFVKSSNISDFTGVTQTDTEIPLGDYFVENIKIPNLQPFEGDMIISGRFGNSIRIGSTGDKKLNTWSNKGNIGDPLLFIRIDKNINENDYIVEDINKDNASLYITDGQSIDFQPNSQIFNSFINDDTPIANIDYLDSQFFITANRININSKTDDILLSSKTATHITSDISINFDAKSYLAIDTVKMNVQSEDILLNCKTSTYIKSEDYITFEAKNNINIKSDDIFTLDSKNEVNINTKTTTLDSNKMYFGGNSKNEKEPLVLGTQLLNTLDDIISELLVMTMITSVGPSGIMLPPSSIKFLTLQTKLKTTKYILSKKSFVE
jgi:hypothetical protein